MFIILNNLNSFKRYCKLISIEEYKDSCQRFRKSIHRTELVASLGILNIEFFHSEGKVLMIVETTPEFDYLNYHTFVNSIQNKENFYINIVNSKPLYENNKVHWGFLERIYELEQTEKYNSEMGQIKLFSNKPSKRFCKWLKLKPDKSLIRRYKEVHDIGAAWPEITQGMHEVGILDMEIYLSGNTAYMIMDIEASQDHDEIMMKLAKKQRQKEWEEYVSVYQETTSNLSAAGKWEMMDRLSLGRIAPFDD